MKFLRYAVVLPLALSFANIASANSNAFYTAPFHNVEVKAASKIYVDYHFAPRSQTLVCTAEQGNDAITSLEWGYKDATRKLELPVTLKDDVGFEGHNADPAGRLIITNDFGSSSNEGSMFVSCEYRNMK